MQVEQIGALISDASEALGLFPSVIRCGENWSARCEEVLQKAQRAVSTLGAMSIKLAVLEATPSVLAESTSNDCLLVAEAVRERCVEAAEKLVRFNRKNGDEQQRARADAFQAGQRHAAQEIRSLDLSGVGVG